MPLKAGRVHNFMENIDWMASNYPAPPESNVLERIPREESERYQWYQRNRWYC